MNNHNEENNQVSSLPEAPEKKLDAMQMAAANLADQMVARHPELSEEELEQRYLKMIEETNTDIAGLRNEVQSA